MYRGFADPIEYEPPWHVPYEVRRQYLNPTGLQILYVYELEDTSTFRYRVFNMVEALNASPRLDSTATWITRKQFHRDQTVVDQADIVVICRTRYDDALARLIERAKGRDAKVLFDVDDLVVDPSYIHAIIDILDVRPTTEDNWNYWHSYVGRNRATLDLCDGVIVTTETLAQEVADRTGKVARVLPNFLNRTQTDVSDRFVANKERRGFLRDGRCTIGYLSGSPTHNRDLLLASAGLASCLKRHPELSLMIVGFIELNDQLLPFADRIETVPLQDYLNLQRLTAQCEFTIVPLRPSIFTRCKSDLKFFESAVVECPVVASPTPSYALAIDDGETGFLARSEEWTDKLTRVIDMAASDGEELLEVGRRARKVAVERYGWDRQAGRIRETLEGFVTGSPGS